MIIRISALALLILFFVPWFSVSCSNQQVELSGLDLTVGKSVRGQKTDSSILVLLMLLLPLATLLAFTIKNWLSKGSLIASASSIVSVLLMIIIRGQVNKNAESQMLNVTDKAGYFLTIAANIIILGSVIYDRYFLSNHEKSDTF